VYYLVLCNGFLGRYYINPNDPELLSFKAKLLRRLPEKPVDIPSLAEEHITPQPYTPTKLGEPILPMWCGHNPLNLLLALAIAIPIAYVVFKVLFDQNSLPDASISEASVSQVEKKFDCSNLNFTINQESKAIAWNGYVKSQEDLTRLETETKQISTVMQVELHNVVVHNWPICEALEVLSPHYGKNPDLKVSTSDKMVNFKEFDIFSVEVIAPTNIPYLYVEYFQREDAGNASVVHMYENYNEVHGNPIIVDKTLDGRKWEIRGPFGEEMIAVIGSDNPLFLDHAHLVQDENTRDYLSKLRKTLSGHTAGVYAFYFFINSREK